MPFVKKDGSGARSVTRVLPRRSALFRKSCPVTFIIPANYRPGYVRLRLQGAPNLQYAEGYTGQSSVTTEGFDPCVVPTLVDHEKACVVIDSARICNYLDREVDSDPVLMNLSTANNANEGILLQASTSEVRAA